MARVTKYLKYDEREKVRQQIIAMRARRYSYAKIGRLLGRNSRTLRSIADVPKPQRRAPHNSYEHRSELFQAAMAMRADGLQWATIADRLQVKQGMIYALCNDSKFSAAAAFGSVDNYST